MGQLQILYTDYNLDREIIAEVICDCFSLRSVSITDLLRKQVAIVSDITLEVKKYLDSGEVIPSYLINQLIDSDINRKKNNNILLLGYPRTIEHFEDFATLLSRHRLPVTNVWYFRHVDFDQFVEHRSEKKSKWIEKFGDEMIANWFSSYKRVSKEIESLKDAFGSLEWREITLAYDNFRDKGVVKNMILRFGKEGF